MKTPPAAAIAALMLGLGAVPARAADHDLQAWGASTATIAAGARGVVWLEGQARFWDDIGRRGQILLRPGVGLKLSPTTTAILGYAYVRTTPSGRAATSEHRIWQQLGYRIAGDNDGATLTGRSRVEQRFVEGASDTGWRLRQQLRLVAPLSGPMTAVGWSEAFVALDRTDWGQRGGFDRLRNFAGVSLPVAAGIMVEPGYMNEYVRQRGPNRMNHILSLTVNTSF